MTVHFNIPAAALGLVLCAAHETLTLLVLTKLLDNFTKAQMEMVMTKRLVATFLPTWLDWGPWQQSLSW